MPKIIINDELNNSQASKINKNLLPNVYIILQCLTLKSANDCFDLERYELLGDCFLKFIIVINLYAKFKKTNEGNLVALKSILVSNKNLYKLALKKKLQNYITSESLLPKVNWLAPNFKSYITNSKSDPLKFKLSEKVLADCVEALLGAYLLYSGPLAAISILEWLDFRISKQDKKSSLTVNSFEDPKESSPDFSIKNDLNKLSNFEQEINYKFKNTLHLYQAFTHPSYTKNRITASYQR
jgi:endoribonuclease Dicer